MMSIGKKKKQNINRELIVGTGALALILPMMLTAVTFSIVGVAMGILLLLWSDDTSTTEALHMMLVYGSSLLVFAVGIRLFIRRYRLLLNRRQALQNENERVAELLDTTSAEQRLSEQLLPDAPLHMTIPDDREESTRHA